MQIGFFQLYPLSEPEKMRGPFALAANLSTSRMIDDIAARFPGAVVHRTAVGEANVVGALKPAKGLLGGEGNGGVILSELHYGRDALAGIALFLTLLVKSGKTSLELRRSYPDYFISKNKINLQPGMDVQALVDAMQVKHAAMPHSTVDGLRIEFGNSWVHLRRSNTEPIIRVYAEAPSMDEADALAQRIMSELRELAEAPGVSR